MILMILGYILQILLLITVGTIIWFEISLFISVCGGAPYVATPNNDIATIMQLLRIKKGTRFYEIGSGDGRILLAAAKRGAVVTGIELNVPLVLWSRWQLNWRGYTKATVLHRNMLDYTYAEADAIFLYMLPAAMARIEPILRHQLKPGTTVVAKAFSFPNWTHTSKEKSFYTYVV